MRIINDRDVLVPDPGKGVCADPVNRGAILEGEGPGPPSGDKERQLSPDKGRGKTWQDEEMAESQGRLPLHGFKTRACTEWVHVHSSRRKCVNILVTLYLLYLLFQENKSFGAITICIHPLMYKKPCREQFCFLQMKAEIQANHCNFLDSAQTNTNTY